MKGRYRYELRTEQDLLQAEMLFKQAIEKDRSYARAYADPMVYHAFVGWMLQLAGRHEEALAFYRKTLSLDSTNAFTQMRIATSSAALNRCDDALRVITWTRPLAYTFFGIPIGYVLASCNRQAEARAFAADLERRAPQLPSAAEELAAVYAALGEKDKAFKWLERAYEERSGPLYKMRADPAFASLRSDPRFQSIVKRMRFP